MQEEKEENEKETTALKMSITRLKANAGKLVKKIDTLTEEISKKNDEKAQMYSRNLTLKSKLANSDTAISVMQISEQDLRQQITEKVEIINALKENITQVTQNSNPAKESLVFYVIKESEKDLAKTSLNQNI